MLCRVAAIKSLPALIYSADYMLLLVFEIVEYILRTRNVFYESYVKILYLNKFEIFWYFFDISVFETTTVIKICKFTVFSSGSFCQIYRVTEGALIAETMVWPNFFLMNVLFAH